MSAWGGVSGLGLGLSLLWTELGKQAGLGRIVRWMASAQATHAGLEGKKGVLSVGADADFVVFDPAAEFEVTKVSQACAAIRLRCIGGPEIQKQTFAIYWAKTARRCREDNFARAPRLGSQRGSIRHSTRTADLIHWFMQ